MAMMMMVEMRPRVHSKKLKKIVSGVNNGFFVSTAFSRLVRGLKMAAEL